MGNIFLPEKTILRKSEFAKRKHRSAGCVTGWIKEGKISVAALIGTGTRARIWVEQAEADLAASLSPGQQISEEFPANERPTVGGERGLLAAVSELEIDRARRAKADADKAEHAAEAARRRLDLDVGRYMDATEARARMAKIAAQTVAAIELALPDLALALVDKFSIPQRDVLHVLREEFRHIRTRAAERLRKEAEMLPELVENSEMAPALLMRAS